MYFDDVYYSCFINCALDACIEFVMRNNIRIIGY